MTSLRARPMRVGSSVGVRFGFLPRGLAGPARLTAA